MGLLAEAMTFAIAAHGETRRKGDGSPAILHAMEAAAVAATLTADQEVLAAAVLHDTVEDAGADLEEIRARQEKVIIFVIARAAQRFLAAALRQRYGFDIFTINGDSTNSIGLKLKFDRRRRAQRYVRHDKSP